MKLINTKHFLLEVTKEFSWKTFCPILGARLVLDWEKNEERIGASIHLILISVYFDWFKNGL